MNKKRLKDLGVLVKIISLLIVTITAVTGCSTKEKLTYLNNLPEKETEEFTIQPPVYRLQSRDVLYITIKAMTPDGFIRDFLTPGQINQSYAINQGEGAGFLYGYDVNSEGKIILPVIGDLKVVGLTLEQARALLQSESDKVFPGSTVECKLLSFKFTVIGEVRSPGSYINYNNYLTVLEAIGRAGGIDDYGRRDRVLVVRPVANGTRTFTLNLQDKNILSNEAFFLLPNDVVIIEPQTKKIFNMNLPTFTFIITSITSLLTSTLLLINYFK